MCTLCWVKLFHTMLQWYEDKKFCFILFSFSADSRHSSNFHCSASEHWTHLFNLFVVLKYGRIFFIRIKLEGAVKVENGGETALKSELGIRHKGRTGREIGNYSWKKVNKWKFWSLLLFNDTQNTWRAQDINAIQVMASSLLHIRKTKVYFVLHQKDGWICHLITQTIMIQKSKSLSIGSEVPISF